METPMRFEDAVALGLMERVTNKEEVLKLLEDERIANGGNPNSELNLTLDMV